MIHENNIMVDMKPIHLGGEIIIMLENADASAGKAIWIYKFTNI